jgi:hypothetical protein
MRIGGEWTDPFKIKFYFGEVDIRRTPPKQVLQLAQWQARWALDTELVEKLICDRDVTVRTEYKYGIQWEAVRRALQLLCGRASATK